jgi:hypothetical protein
MPSQAMQDVIDAFRDRQTASASQAPPTLEQRRAAYGGTRLWWGSLSGRSTAASTPRWRRCSSIYGVQLWMPRAGGRVDYRSEHGEQAMTVLGRASAGTCSAAC